jgi:hypothetical protein
VVTYQERLAAEEVEEAPSSPFVQEYYPLFALLSMARRIQIPEIACGKCERNEKGKGLGQTKFG